MNIPGLSFDVTVDFPAIILILILFLGMYVLWRTQRANNDFDFSDMLREDSGKPSSARMAVFVCLAVSTWGFMYILITNKGQIDTTLFVAYIAIWSGAKVAERGIDAYLNRSSAPPAVVTPVVKPKAAAKPTPPVDDSDETPAH